MLCCYCAIFTLVWQMPQSEDWKDGVCVVDGRNGHSTDRPLGACTTVHAWGRSNYSSMHTLTLTLTLLHWFTDSWEHMHSSWESSFEFSCMLIERWTKKNTSNLRVAAPALRVACPNEINLSTGPILKGHHASTVEIDVNLNGPSGDWVQCRKENNCIR